MRSFYINKLNIDYWSAFLMMAAFVFSNLFKREFPIHIVLSIASSFLVLLIIKKIDLFRLFIFIYIYILSTLLSADGEGYLITLIYKAITLIPIFVLVRRYKINDITRGVFHAISLSIIVSIIFIVAGLSHDKFILYIMYIDAPFPRFAALAIEPVSLALSLLCLSIALYLSDIRLNYLNKTMVFISSIMTLSTFIVFLLFTWFNMFFRRAAKWILYPFLMAILLYIFLNTRFIDSVEHRLFLYGEVLKKIDIGFWGTGLYANKDLASGLPGLLRMFNECGTIMSTFILVLILSRIVKYKKLDTILLLGATLPFLTEAYGSPILWFLAFLCIASSKRGTA